MAIILLVSIIVALYLLTARRATRLEARVGELERRLAGQSRKVEAAPRRASAQDIPVVAPARPMPRPSHTAPEAKPATAAPSSWATVRPIVSWLFGGNTVARVGVVVLFFGAAFFLNYLADQGWLPIGLRLGAAAVAGLSLIALGWRLRRSRPDYALPLQGGGVGIVYLTTFAAVNLYDLIGVGAGLTVMVALVLLGATLAVYQDARSQATLATIGGFLGPVLVSRDASHIALLSYYLTLDVGVLAVAWFRAWRFLNLVGFVFTFIVGAAWGYEFYQPEFFATTEPFLVAFFVFFVAVSVLFSWRQEPRPGGYVDGTLVFGTPLLAFALQTPLVSEFEYGLAFSALTLSVFYAAVAASLHRTGPPSLSLLVVSFAALSVAFGTLAIPLAVDGRWTAGAWALEGAALVWTGVRQRRSLAIWSGLLLQLAAGYALLLETSRPAGELAFLNIVYLGALMVSLSGLFSAWQLYRERHAGTEREVLSIGALGWSGIWWLGAGADEISRYVPLLDQTSASVAFVALSAATCAIVRRVLDWKHLGTFALMLLPTMVLFVLTLVVTDVTHPLTRWGIAAWPAAFVTQYWIVWRLETDWPKAMSPWHSVGLWLVVFFVSWEAAWCLGEAIPGRPPWPFVGWGLVPLASVAALARLGDTANWPFGRHRDAYLGAGILPLVGGLSLWVLVASVQRADPSPLPYLPFINPVELTQILALVGLLWWSQSTPNRMTPTLRWGVWSFLAFAALNGAVARGTHFLAGVPFEVSALWTAAVFQTALSITWTTLALAVMFTAARIEARSPWAIGAALLSLVVAKLFLVDLADIGTIARIVSFVVVGLLILVIGYLSPLPPKREVEG